MYKLLIVDDEDIVREGLCELIAHMQIDKVGTILTAKDGESAWSICQTEQPHIVLTDLNMPGLDGLGLIQRLQGNSHAQKVVVISGYGDFHLVKESFKLGVRDYLLKPAHSEELLEVLEKTVRELQLEEQQNQNGESERLLLQMERISRSMNRIIQADERNDAVFMRLFKQADFNLIYPITTVAIVSLVQSGPVLETAGEYWTSHLLSFGREHPNVQFFMFYNRQNDLVVWINCESQQSSLIPQVLLKLLSGAGNTPYVAALGKPAAGAQGLAEAYYSAEESLKYRLTVPPSSLITNEEITRRLVQDIEAKDLRLLTEMVELGRKEHIHSFVQKYFNDELLRQSRLESILSNYNAILNTIGWVHHQKQDFYSFQQAEQLRLYLISCILQTITARQSVLRNGDVVEMAKKYVEEHLLEDINMAVIANYCNVSYTYFSKIFKETTGENYQDYILMKRMEYARKALDEIHVKIYDVAAALGYSNPKNFSRVFKSYCGMSPKEYQNRLKK